MSNDDPSIGGTPGLGRVPEGRRRKGLERRNLESLIEKNNKRRRGGRRRISVTRKERGLSTSSLKFYQGERPGEGWEIGQEGEKLLDGKGRARVSLA